MLGYEGVRAGVVCGAPGRSRVFQSVPGCSRVLRGVPNLEVRVLIFASGAASRSESPYKLESITKGKPVSPRPARGRQAPSGFGGELLHLLSVSGAVRDVGAFGALSKRGTCRSVGAIAFCSSECSRGRQASLRVRVTVEDHRGGPAPYITAAPSGFGGLGAGPTVNRSSRKRPPPATPPPRLPPPPTRRPEKPAIGS